MVGSLAAVVALLACGGDSSGPKVEGTIAIAAGTGQSAVVGTTLAPLQVLVTDRDGAPVPGAAVTWSVAGGGGSLSSASTVANAAGIAEVVSTLDTVTGVQSVRASASGFAGSPLTFQNTGLPGPASTLRKVRGDLQTTPRTQTVAVPPTVKVADSYGNGVSGIPVSWTVTTGGGSITSGSTSTAATGEASVGWTLGPAVGANALLASWGGGDTVQFTATGASTFLVLGGGNNVTERYTSDLWVAEGYAYTGTWGFRGNFGNAVKIWQLDGGGSPALVDSIIVPGIQTVSDIEVSPDGNWLVFTTEYGPNEGIYVYELTAPGAAVYRANLAVPPNGLHTGTLSVIDGKLYAFGAKDPASCALKIYDLSAAGSGTITEASSTPIPDNYCIHDTFVRDGYAFVFAWDEGLYIFDVGNGSHGGSPASPVQVSHTNGYGGESHNGWWFHNPVSGEKRYLFIGEEGPGVLGSSSSGNIHVVDVSNLAAPVEVASFALPGAGTHNFWVDEANLRLYAAYYNGGVVALDISGTLSGNLASRKITDFQPGGAGNTYVWGVMLYNGSLYASDMISGLWQLAVP